MITIETEKAECKSLMELRALKKKAKKLYKSTKVEDSDKIKLLDVIGDLENKIRQEEFKEKLLNGEV